MAKKKLAPKKSSWADAPSKKEPILKKATTTVPKFEKKQSESTKPIPKKKKEYTFPESFAGKEIKGKIFKDVVLASANFAGATLVDCSFPNLKQIRRCDFSGTKFLKSDEKKTVDSEGKKKVAIELTPHNPFEKITEKKKIDPKTKKVEVTTIKTGPEIINCDVNNTTPQLESQRINFA